jgi:hypothetical protein
MSANLPDYEIVEVYNTIDEDTESREKYALFKNEDYIGYHIKLSGVYQPEIIKTCLQYMTDKTKNVLDIGANMGSFTVPVARNITGTVYSFELQRHIFMQLSTNCFINRLANVSLMHGFVANTEYINNYKYTTVPLVNHHTTKNTGAFSINDEHRQFCNLINTYLPPVIEDKRDVVPNVCIDDLCIQNIGFIKIDVEGAELDVIKGLLHTIQQNNYPPLLFECFMHEEYATIRNRLFEYILSCGYNEIRPVENTDDNFVAVRVQNT